jgi:transcriptional regulator with XRE-family HTH domain
VAVNHWSERLKRRLKEKGWTQRELARRSGISEDLIRKYYQGVIDQPRGDALKTLAKTLECSRIWLELGVSIQNMTMPLLGYVGAGEEFFADGELTEKVEIRAEELDLFGVTVRGTSGLPAYRPGEVVVCSRSAGVTESNYLNTDAVVRLRDGRAYLKRVTRGNISGTYTLHSYNAEPIENVRIEWAAPVVMVLRKPGLLVNY